MACDICGKPNTTTNHARVQELWDNVGGATGNTLAATDPYQYLRTLRLVLGYTPEQPCNLCLPAPASAAAPSRPTASAPAGPYRKENQELADMVNELGSLTLSSGPEGQRAIDDLVRKFEEVRKATPGQRSTSLRETAGDVLHAFEDAQFSLSQQMKLTKACGVEGLTQMQRCAADIKNTNMIESVGASSAAIAAATKLGGKPLTGRAILAQASVDSVVRAATIPSCAEAAKAMVGDACMRRAMPQGYIPISTRIRNKQNKAEK